MLTHSLEFLQNIVLSFVYIDFKYRELIYQRKNSKPIQRVKSVHTQISDRYRSKINKLFVRYYFLILFHLAKDKDFQTLYTV